MLKYRNQILILILLLVAGIIFHQFENTWFFAFVLIFLASIIALQKSLLFRSFKLGGNARTEDASAQARDADGDPIMDTLEDGTGGGFTTPEDTNDDGTPDLLGDDLIYEDITFDHYQDSDEFVGDAVSDLETGSDNNWSDIDLLDGDLEDESPEVMVSSFVPPNLRKGKWFTIQSWLHFVSDYLEVEDRASGTNHGTTVGKKFGLKVNKGALVTFQLMPGELEFRSGLEESSSLVSYTRWNGNPTNVEFQVRCPVDISANELIERIEIFVDEVPIGVCTIQLAFQNDSAHASASSFDSIKTVFVSYSSEDKRQVIGRLQALEASIGLIPFLDVLEIRCGEDWEEKLIREVPTKDAFLLFWSENARESEWVEREWRLALDKRGIKYIKPMPLEPVDPPAELAKLQFADKWSRMAHYESLKQS